MQDGKVDSRLLALDRDVELWRDVAVATRPRKEIWRMVNLAMPDMTTPAN